jgi:hypothetical protein
MSILCAFGGHEAGPEEVYNSGYWFSRCRRCRRDMIRSGGSWDVIPRGHRVVWRSGRGSHSLATDFAHVLPVLHPAANLPMVRPRFASWSRQLAPSLLPAKRRSAGAAAEATDATGAQEPPYPLLMVAALVAGALQLVFGLSRRRAGLG